MSRNVRSLARRGGAALAAAATALTTLGAAGATAAPPSDATKAPRTGASGRAEPAAAEEAETAEIAATVLGRDHKITLTAVRSENDRYTASVRMQVYAPSGAGWQETDRVTVGEVDGWFWYPLTGSRAVCEFSTASTNPAPIRVSLLITPSLGCAPTAHFTLRDGRIHAG
ncbi:hypothetical protein [Streptomyces sp. URMC 123]|uniref:hypothetical protein n=1 Tax=Streptomyces sp. URMC 123 TaxID=3423403 RepID=UPI003F197167